jgi:phosphatidyl-myo-inositol dimannoside synthase
VRIGLIAPVFLPLISGASLYCFELARAIASYGHDVHVFSPPGGREDPAYTLHTSLSCRLPDDITPLLEHKMDIWHSLYFVYAPMAFDVQPFFVTVHGDDAFSFFVPYRLPLRRLITRYILWRLSPSFRGRIDKWLNGMERIYDKKLASRAIGHVSQIVAVSSFTRNRLIDEYPRASDRVTIIPPGISEMFFIPTLPQPDNTKTTINLLTVTRLDDAYRIKNVHGVIAALGRLKDKYNFIYTIVSGTEGGNYRAELEQQVQQLALQDHVVFTGRLSDEQLLNCYQHTDLFILASYAEPDNFEGFGIVFLEANASGVPVLTTRSGGMADYVVDGENGLYADDPFPEAIGRALIRFFEGEVTFDKAKLRAFADPYRWKNIARRVLDMYSDNDAKHKD